MTSPIRVENLVKTFRKVEALHGLNLEVPSGAIYALVGPNGAGKTTTIKILMNILQPTSGSAKVLGIDSTELEGQAFAGIGYVSENQQLPLWMRVDNFLAYLRPFYPSWDLQLENDLVKRFDLPLDRKLRELSRGMRMKAVLAGSLAYRPSLILLDEPLSGLDPLVRDELIESIVTRANGSTILVSSHDLGEIESFATHVGYMEDGAMLFSDEMVTLAGRFREVELTLSGAAALPSNLPVHWLQPRCSGNVVHFTESRFDQQNTSEQIQGLFGNYQSLTFKAMSLREIFLSTARKSRQPGEGQQA